MYSSALAISYTHAFNIGLGLLIPHLLTLSSSFLEGAKLRVFTVAASHSQLQKEQRSMAALLSRFRIDYSNVYVIPDLAKRPNKTTVDAFKEFIVPFLKDIDEKEEILDEIYASHLYISDAEFIAMKGKTYRELRIRELLHQHSQDATLIVLTLPIPRKGVLSAGLYLGWLDFVTKDMNCPVLYLRGNQQSVLTFYS
ncbi:unnamed protein product [Soboliphyme baturini]|uniref:SLC12A transporter C-terminal domain-containing protein n=1 Tax=Soboliphyme baturini TaxID=241478 RepID=A0A3P8D0E2_9BILA|nr:unnamed protein product [Soboliphyme baturini]